MMLYFSIIFTITTTTTQVVCGVGRENIESWGRKRRSLHTYETDNEMLLNREILVFDFNDPAESSKSTSDMAEMDEAMVKAKFESLDRCGSRNTVVALSIISAVLVVIYVCTVAYFTATRRTPVLASKGQFR